MRRLALVWICLVSAAAVSCDGDGTNPSQAKSNPCSILEINAVEAATGSKVVSEQRVASMGSSSTKPLCAYEVGRPFGSVVVYLNRAGKAEFKERFETIDKSTEAIAGVGGAAYLRGGTSASALIGQTYVAVDTQYYTSEASGVVRQLLRRAVTSL